MAAALAFTGGILFSRYVWHPAWMWMAATVLMGCAAAFAVRTNARVGYCAALACVGMAGGFTATAQQPATRPDLSLRRFADGSELLITGRVLKDGAWRESAYGGREQLLDLGIEEIGSEAGVERIEGSARLTVYARRTSAAEFDDTEEGMNPGGEPFARFEYGQRLRLRAKLHKPLNYGNPGAFDYRGYLLSQGIVAVGSARAESVEVVPGFSGSRAEAMRWRVRRSVLEHIHRTWDGERAALIDAMLIGERAFITRELRGAFQRSGTYHILVVSGMNVGILAVVVFWVLRRLRMNAAISTAITILLACGYAYLTDAGAPIVRAALMLAVYLIARLLYRDRAALNAVGLAALLILAIDPHSVFEPSFQLTFLSVVAIAGVGVPLLERTSEGFSKGVRNIDLISYDAALPAKIAQFRLDLRLIMGRIARFVGRRLSRMVVVGAVRGAIGLYELVVISGLMQVVLALPMAWYFHRATSMALPANLLIVPLTGVLMPASVAAVVLSYAWMPLAKVPAMVAAWSLDGITGAVKLMGGLRAADVRVPMPTMWVMVAAVLTLALAVTIARRHRVLLGVALVGLSISAWAITWPRPFERRPGMLEVTAIDVGQGDSLLIVTPEGKALLLDAGGQLGNSNSGFDVGEDVVSPYLWQRGISRLDAVAISHAHSDHMGGIGAVVRNFRPAEVWMGKSVSTKGLELLRQTASEFGAEWVERKEGDQFQFGGAHFEFFAPQADWELKSRVRDDDAMVFRIRYGNNSALLPGDGGKRLEQKLAAVLPRCDLLKVPHHGSTTSSSPEFLNAVRPKFGVISVGARNSFRHPRPEVLARLDESGVMTFRTDTVGAVSFYMDGKTIRAERIPRY